MSDGQIDDEADRSVDGAERLVLGFGVRQEGDRSDVGESISLS